MAEPVIKVRKVSKTFKLKNQRRESLLNWIKNLMQPGTSRQMQVLKGLSFDVNKGEHFGIIGGNGSGKSTLVKLISGAYVADSGGVVHRKGRTLMLSLGVGMNQELTARENIIIYGLTLGMTLDAIRAKVDEIIQFAELEDFKDVKIQNFSSGMKSKLSFSVAIHADADILLLDEVFAVGDHRFRRKAIDALESNWLAERTVVLISHSMGDVKKYCKRVLYLKDGQIEYLGDPAEAVRRYEADN